ncbi:MAG: hypothetical protein ABEL76_07910 [Bradymonadaceae bacterium]
MADDSGKTDDLREAKRRAEVIASDIAIYPDLQERIERGVKNDNLFEELDDVLRDARKNFRSHVDEEIVEDTIVFEMQIIDKIFAPAGQYDSEIW